MQSIVVTPKTTCLPKQFYLPALQQCEDMSHFVLLYEQQADIVNRFYNGGGGHIRPDTRVLLLGAFRIVDDLKSAMQRNKVRARQLGEEICKVLQVTNFFISIDVGGPLRPDPLQEKIKARFIERIQQSKEKQAWR